jgi:hypothetical protein
MNPEPSILEAFDQIERQVQKCPDNLETVITELHSLLNKYDPTIAAGQRSEYKLVRYGFNADEVLRSIRELAKAPNLKVTQIRFKADELSRQKRIPLPNSTRKHKNALLQWFQIHWRELAVDIAEWRADSIPGADARVNE